ncbi:MAG: TraR/DksA family transcriptional regulator [Amphritea sp.]
MNAAQLQEFKHLLDSLELELEDEVASLRQSAQPVELDQQAFGRVSRGDALQQQNMAKANLEQCEQRLADVHLAQNKFADGEYGYCESCDELIPLARLKARPDSHCCIQCQEKQEQ